MSQDVSGKLSFISIIAAVFLVIAPLSLATQWETSSQLKLLRIAICLLGAIIALFSGALKRMGPSSRSMLSFAAVYVLAAAWSNYPLQGVAYKMLFFSSLCLGIGFATAFPHKESLAINIRFLAAMATAAALITWYQYWRNPVESTRVGRLAIHGINANAVGMTAAGYLFLTVYSALNDKGLWKWLNAVGTGILITLVVATGSRAALALAILGAAIQWVPWLRNPARLIVPAVVVALILLAFSATLPVEAVERITDVEKNTRAGMWQAGIRLFLEEPIIGHGWVSGSGRSTGNLQSVYFQVLAETGVVGASVFVAALLTICITAARVYSRVPREELPRYWLAIAILGGLATHGVAESAVILGTTVNTFFMGFGLGLLENILQWCRYPTNLAIGEGLYPFARPSTCVGSHAYPPRHPQH